MQRLHKVTLQMEIGNLSLSPSHLSDAHGAQDVKEDEGAISIVIPKQIAVAEALQPRDGNEGQLGHHTPIKAVAWDKTPEL